MDNIISGFLSGSLSTFITHPLDTLKILNQNNIKPQYNIKLFRGASYPILTSGITNGLLFYSFEQCKHITNNNYISGALSGALNSIIINPIEDYKINKQVNQQFKFKPFKGLYLTTIRDSIGCCIYFGMYHKLREKKFSPLISGGVCGVSSWLCTYPIDVIKTRIQSSNLTLNESIRLRGYWKGISYCCLRSSMGNSIIFCCYELLQKNNYKY